MLPTLLLAATVACPAGDLARERPVTGAVDRGNLASVTWPDTPADGSPWDSPDSVQMHAGQSITIDLGEVQTIAALTLQADNDDLYMVETAKAPDDALWELVWTAGRARGGGLRVRSHKFMPPFQARLLRITPRGGDGQYAIARLHAYCQPPPDLANEPSRWNPIEWWRSLDDDSMMIVKGVLAGLGTLLLLANLLLARLGRAALLRRARDGLLAFLGIASFAAFFNFFHFHFDLFVHRWELYHYYVGARYFPELGYTRLYECTVVAEAELFGRESIGRRMITDLTTNEMVPVEPVLDAPATCTDHFTPERWTAFKHDVAYFRGQFNTSRWIDVMHDHGYNATPVWTIGGRALASLAPASNQQITRLALVDPLLLVVMWAFVLWAFGWRTACVALLWWGTNYPARYWWNGGAFLRMDWLAAAVVGICMMRKNRPLASGFLMCTSALLRVFPGFIAVGIVLKIAWDFWKTRTISPLMRRFIAGAVAAVVVLVPLSFVAAGASSYPGFIANSKKHLHTPLTNNMGLKTVVAYQPATRAKIMQDPSFKDPFGRWKDARRKLAGDRAVLFWIALAAFLALLARAVISEPARVGGFSPGAGERSTIDDHVAALVLGVGLIAVASELTCYYYSIYLVYAFLWPRRPWIGVVLLLLSTATCVVPWLRGWDDERFFYISVLVALFAYGVAAVRARQPAPQGLSGNGP